MNSVYSFENRDKIFKPYEYVYINNFDINNINIKKEKNKDEAFNNAVTVEYNKNGFYLIPIKCFRSYGIKNVEALDEEINKISIIFDDNNKYQNLYKDILEKLYKRVDIALKKINVSVIHPFGEKRRNTIDLIITKYTKFYAYNNIEAEPIALNTLYNLSNISFKIAPIVQLRKFIIKDNKCYFNFMIKEAYLQFDKPVVPFDALQNMFQADINDYIDNNSTTSDQDDDYL